jgi:transcriptional regulator with XRE-family HTH domain
VEVDFLDLEKAPETPQRAKTSIRMKYEAQVQVIKKQAGDLEDIRIKLNLSQRQICQLLLVDPSAWTRWTKHPNEDAPPHIYRALQWYLTLNEKIPGLTPHFFIEKDPQIFKEIEREQAQNKLQYQQQFMQIHEALEKQNDYFQIQSQNITKNLEKKLVFTQAIMVVGFVVMIAAILV